MCQFDRFVYGVARGHHSHVHLSLPCQPDTGNQTCTEVDHASIDSRHVGVRVKHYWPPCRCWRVTDDSGRLGHTGRILIYIVRFERIFSDKPQTIFSVASEKFAFWLRGITGLPFAAGESQVGQGAIPLRPLNTLLPLRKSRCGLAAKHPLQIKPPLGLNPVPG